MNIIKILISIFLCLLFLFSSVHCTKWKYNVSTRQENIKYETKKNYYFFTASGFLPIKKRVKAFDICKNKQIQSVALEYHVGWTLICTYSLGMICVRRGFVECY